MFGRKSKAMIAERDKKEQQQQHAHSALCFSSSSLYDGEFEIEGF